MLERITNGLKSLATKRNLMILIVVLVFAAVSYYAYQNYIVPSVNPKFVENREFDDKESSNENEIIFFYVDWCPHCKTARPQWDAVKKTYHGKQINNKVIYFKEINCEKNEDMADKYNVEGYPTIKLVKENEIVEFDAKPTEETLTQFLHSTL